MLRACPGGFWSGPPHTDTPRILPPRRHCWLGRESTPAAWTTSYKSQGGTLGKRTTQIQYVNSERFNLRKMLGFLHKKKNEKGLEVVLITLKITSWHFQQSITAWKTGNKRSNFAYDLREKIKDEWRKSRREVQMDKVIKGEKKRRLKT